MTWEWVVLILGLAYWIAIFYVIDAFKKKWGVQ